MAEQKEKLYYTPDELTNILPIGRTLVYRHLNDGTIPSIRMGKRFVIPKSAITRWLDSAQSTGVQNAA